MNKIFSKKAQSEFVGFGIIVIIVSILILILVSVSIKKETVGPVESHETESFLQVLLEHTSTCANNYEPNYLVVRELIYECEKKTICVDGNSSCKILNETLKNLVDLSWNVGENYPTKGYEFKITSLGKDFFSIEKGNVTKTSKGSVQSFDSKIDVSFVVYI